MDPLDHGMVHRNGLLEKVVKILLFDSRENIVSLDQHIAR